MKILKGLFTIIILLSLSFSSFGLELMTDAQLDEITGQAGIDLSFSNQLGLEFAGRLLELRDDGVVEITADRILNLAQEISYDFLGLSANVTIGNVINDTTGNLTMSFNNGEVYKVSYPTRIENLSFENIRIGNSPDSLGSLHIGSVGVQINGHVNISFR